MYPVQAVHPLFSDLAHDLYSVLTVYSLNQGTCMNFRVQ